MMNKINISKWGKFKISKLFDIHPTKAYNLTNAYLLSDFGENPVIVNSQYNNGIGGFTEQKATEKGNIITFSDTTSSNTIFYQEKDFVGYPHVQGMYPIGKYKEKWNKYSLLYFVTVFRTAANLKYFDFVNKFTRDDASTMEICLPVTLNNEIDFIYMETYIKNLQITIEDNLNKLLSTKYEKLYKINIDGWKEFKVGTLFNIIKPKVLHSREVIEDTNNTGIPYIVRTKFNNGTKFKVLEKNDMELSPAGVISFGAENSSFFYQEKPFVSGRDIYYIDTQKLDKYSCLFLISCLNFITHKYSYNYGLFPELLKNEIIKLPVDKSEKPNYKYMSSYIKNLFDCYSKKLKSLNK